ncbi:asparagine synthase (glutamine-hydrolyzing) [Mesorhizobium sp. BAC0120]|uniref:asparagine synthase (glutamine-hydrolyzing) n=1 Tax=Mesorhizobium sp. BAC0120 TaxID=3090670 RepID=UPI00298C4527|nr:asparagine synthase (glutamine-hydrolyzing) [Mesorhizobium sp. BAC0120]MDW6020966.1 asparagine synthase (glutamine-hydrolyzing) [Mesorhizobium sp. BAC0120]
MCGIAGILETNASSGIDRETVRRMTDFIMHRGPDDGGEWTDPEAGIGLAQRRLAIIDLSPAGHQPMISHSGRYVIVFNGEMYNFRELRQRLDSETNIEWRGHSDTEVLLAAIERWGVKAALQASVGMFALALWDRKERRLFLARDRVGEKPLYYGRIGRRFAFASELKAFRALPSWKPEIDRGALALLMRHNYVPAPYSIYKGVQKLLPGCLLTLSSPASEPQVEPYWSAREAAEQGRDRPFEGSPQEAVTELEALLRQSLNGQMMADVPLGAFLSGGVDSSTVVALMQSMSSQPVRTFTIGFQQTSYNEADHAKQVAQHLGTDHTELYVSEKETMDVIPNLPEIYCEPFADSSQIPTYLVSRLARQRVTVSLSGDAGDELFSGYTRYSVTDAFWNRLSRIPGPLRSAIAGLATLPAPAFYDRLVGPLMPLMPEQFRFNRFGDKVHKGAELLSLRTPNDVYRRLCSHWADPSQIVVGSEEPATMLTGLEGLPSLQGNVERMMYLDLKSYLPDDILVKVDRAAMAVSLETRVPLLDHRLVEFAFSLPLSVLRAEGTTKWPLRQILYKYVPKALIERPKMGFGVPIGDWLRGALRDWAEDLLSERRLQADGILRPEPIRHAWSEHLSGRRDNQYLLWDVLMFQAWRDKQRECWPAMAA